LFRIVLGFLHSRFRRYPRIFANTLGGFFGDFDYFSPIAFDLFPQSSLKAVKTFLNAFLDSFTLFALIADYIKLRSIFRVFLCVILPRRFGDFDRIVNYNRIPEINRRKAV
jgi:hypothetical protein